MPGTIKKLVIWSPLLTLWMITAPADAYSLLKTAWEPGADTARIGGNPAPGGATWSIMGQGIYSSFPDDLHGGNSTQLITSLVVDSTIGDFVSIFDEVMDTWASVSGFSNLGQVADNGANIGNSGPGTQGDIRFAAIYMDGNSGANVLAHAYSPCSEALCFTTIGGDTHFDTGNIWSFDGMDGVDFFTVALHEVGHALGLGHSNVEGSVMHPSYGGLRRALHTDDIAGIQAIYGATVVPLPPAILFMLTGLALLGLFNRICQPASTA